MSASLPGGRDREGEDDMASGIVGIQEYTVNVPPKKAFLPWHKPRKQFVRNDQWCHFIGEMLDEMQVTNGTLTYFGLPGADLLDLRYFGSIVCDPRSLKLRFLGFVDAADPQNGDQVELNISYDELSKSASVDPTSEIVSDDFRQLVNEDSIAWQKTLDLGPYDVVNLDLCDGFGAKAPGKINKTYYNAVSKLLAVQARKKTPWLLLLTTRVGIPWALQIVARLRRIITRHHVGAQSLQYVEHRKGRGIQDDRLPAALAVREEEAAALEIDMLPAQVQDFPQAAAGEEKQAERCRRR